jgi:hypothetical protein
LVIFSPSPTFAEDRICLIIFYHHIWHIFDPWSTPPLLAKNQRMWFRMWSPIFQLPPHLITTFPHFLATFVGFPSVFPADGRAPETATPTSETSQSGGRWSQGDFSGSFWDGVWLVDTYRYL